MKSISVDFKAHLALELTTLCTCWKVTRTDGQVFGFTDHVIDLEVDSITYLAAVGYTPSSIQTAAALNVDNLEVDGGIDNDVITESDLLAGRWDFAQVEIFQVNYADLSQGTLKLRKGWLGEVLTGRQQFVVELRGMMQKLQQATGYLVTPACNADLGDDRCKVDLGPFTEVSAVTAVTSNRVFAASGLASFAANWFAGGKLTWTSGENDGLAMEVKQFDTGTGTFHLTLPMPFDVSVTDAFSVYAGCDKSLATCRDKFNNVVNFRGFPHLPGITRIASGS